MFVTSMWVAITLLWIVAAVRVWLCLRGPSVWRVAYTIGITALALACTVNRLQPQVNEIIGIANVGNLISHIFANYAAAGTAVYIHCLRRTDPRPATVPVNMAVATLVSLIVTGFWLAAPIHSQPWPRFEQVPVTWLVVGYNATFYAYLGGVLFLVYLAAKENLDQSPGFRDDPGRTLGGITICASLGIGTIYILGCNLPRLVAAAAGHMQLANTIDIIGKVLLPIALAGIATSTLLFIGGHLLTPYLGALRTIYTLGPLWRWIRDHHPAYTLSHSSWHGHRSLIIRAQRMQTEILDALHLTLLPQPVRSDENPYPAVIRAMLDPAPGAAIPAISTISGGDETITTQLARTYRQLSRETRDNHDHDRHSSWPDTTSTAD